MKDKFRGSQSSAVRIRARTIARQSGQDACHPLFVARHKASRECADPVCSDYNLIAALGRRRRGKNKFREADFPDVPFQLMREGLVAIFLSPYQHRSQHA